MQKPHPSQDLRQDLDNKIEQFLREGGVIQKISSGKSGEPKLPKSFREYKHKPTKSNP